MTRNVDFVNILIRLSPNPSCCPALKGRTANYDFPILEFVSECIMLRVQRRTRDAVSVGRFVPHEQPDVVRNAQSVAAH